MTVGGVLGVFGVGCVIGVISMGVVALELSDAKCRKIVPWANAATLDTLGTSLQHPRWAEESDSNYGKRVFEVCGGTSK